MRIGLHALDAALAIAREGELCSMRASIVGTNLQQAGNLGVEAARYFRRLPHAASTQHWRNLGNDALADSALQWVSAELRSRSAELRASSLDDTLIMEVAVPSGMPSSAVTRLLMAAQAESLPIAGFHDASALAVAAAGVRGTTLVIELGLHHLSVSRVAMLADEARVLEVDTREGCGLLALHEAWLQLASETMVLQRRFDPLHEGDSEQRLYDALIETLPTLVDHGVATLRLETAAGPCEVSIAKEQFVQRAAVVTRELSAILRGLRSAGQPINVLVRDDDFLLPGIAVALDELRHCSVRVISGGLVARAVSLQSNELSRGPVALRRQISMTAPLEQPTDYQPQPDLARHAIPPSHVFHAGTALPIAGSRSFEIGRSPDNAGLVISPAARGVSRRHCTLRSIDGELYVIDHSRYGTWLNDERVAGCAQVFAGDRLRIGDPGLEFELISVGVGDGPSSG